MFYPCVSVLLLIRLRYFYLPICHSFTLRSLWEPFTLSFLHAEMTTAAISLRIKGHFVIGFRMIFWFVCFRVPPDDGLTAPVADVVIESQLEVKKIEELFFLINLAYDFNHVFKCYACIMKSVMNFCSC
jgi:hypothetical protein